MWLEKWLFKNVYTCFSIHLLYSIMYRQGNKVLGSVSVTTLFSVYLEKPRVGLCSCYQWGQRAAMGSLGVSLCSATVSVAAGLQQNITWRSKAVTAFISWILILQSSQDAFCSQRQTTVLKRWGLFLLGYLSFLSFFWYSYKKKRPNCLVLLRSFLGVGKLTVHLWELKVLWEKSICGHKKTFMVLFFQGEVFHLLMYYSCVCEKEYKEITLHISLT